MKITTICLAISLGLIALSSCKRVRETTSNSGPSKTSLSGTPEAANVGTPSANRPTGDASGQDSFWAAAASGGMAEVEAGQVAQTKAQSPEVKEFARMMVEDHTKSNEELKALAGKHNVGLPTGPDAQHRAALDQMKNMSGAEFDRAYVDAMVKDHEATVQLFESHAGSNGDPDSKGFAAKNLPALRQHLEMVRAIRAKMQ